MAASRFSFGFQAATPRFRQVFAADAATPDISSLFCRGFSYEFHFSYFAILSMPFSR
jgi:hypothetical protein